MSVESVNNNSNAGLYALSGAVLGAGAGTAAAYLTRPYLKDGNPTDEFTKKIYEKAIESFPEKSKEAEELLKSVQEAKSIENIKEIFTKIEPSKLSTPEMMEELKSMGFDVKQEVIDEFKKAKTVEAKKEIIGKLFDKTYSGKNVDEIKNAIKEEIQNIKKQSGKVLFEKFWDTEKKEFKNCEEGQGKAVKKAARSIQGKWALIYGSISAAVLGLIMYFATANKKPAQQHADKGNYIG